MLIFFRASPFWEKKTIYQPEHAARKFLYLNDKLWEMQQESIEFRNIFSLHFLQFFAAVSIINCGDSKYSLHSSIAAFPIYLLLHFLFLLLHYQLFIATFLNIYCCTPDYLLLYSLFSIAALLIIYCLITYYLLLHPQ